MTFPTIMQLASVCAILLAAGIALLAGLTVIPKTSRSARALWPNLNSAIITITVTVGALTLGGVVAKGFVVLLVLRVNYEAASVVFARLPSLPRAITQQNFAFGIAGLSILLLGLATLLDFDLAVMIAVGLFILAVMAALWLKGRAAGIICEIIAFPLLPMLVVALAAPRSDLSVLALAAYMIVETFDGYAVFGGRMWGRRLAFPTLSPHKTIAGLITGAAMLALTTTAVGYGLSGLSPLVTLPFALLAGILSLAGDLGASALKRRSGVKDFPQISRIQGGMFDIYDAWIATFSGLVVALVLLTGGR